MNTLAMILLQVENLSDMTERVTPYSEYTFGFLTLILVTAIIILWRYINKLVANYLDASEKVINRNTIAFEKYNDIMTKKVDSDIHLKEKIISMMSKIEETDKKQNQLLEKTEVLINQVSSKIN